MLENQDIPNDKPVNWKKTLLICGIILIVGGVATTLIFFTEPTAMRAGATKETAMLVEVTEVRQGTFQPTIVATGTVQPAQDIILSPRVSGEIIQRSPAFVPGGFVKKGEVLLQIDPADYKNTLELRKSELHQVLADLAIEKGRQDVALKDYELIGGDTLSEENEALVLREPQLNAVRASVEAARASVQQAALDLERTTIRAPFDAHILSRNANIGSQVAPGNELGRLVGVDAYWVVATVPLSKLRWLSFPDADAPGAMVRVRDRTAWGEEEYREGYLYKLVGALEDQTRLARILVSVPDPLAYKADSVHVPPLMIGAFMETHIQGNNISDVIRLSRDYVRQNETVWVMEEGKLRIQDVEIVFSDAEYAYISKGLEENDQVVTTNLSTVVEGAKLRLASADSTSGQDSLESSEIENQASGGAP